MMEDTIHPTRSHVIDAVRISDGTKVYLKKIYHEQHPHEAPIHLMLSSMRDPQNHCVPLIQLLEPELEGDGDIWILVMPLLSRYNDPLFDTFGEVVEFLRQVFEGVQFLHHNRVAHRDIHALNMMVDASPLCHEEFHPLRQEYDPEHQRLVKKCTRTKHPVRYYIIDFGLSRQYSPKECPPREMPILGIDKTVPEFLLDEFSPWDPFPTDIYYLGNMIRQELIDGNPLYDTKGYSGFKFLKPLVNDMVQDDPVKRPTIDEVVFRYHTIISNLGYWKLSSRLPDRRESFFKNILYTLKHWNVTLENIRKGLKPVPFVSA